MKRSIFIKFLVTNLLLIVSALVLQAVAFSLLQTDAKTRAERYNEVYLSQIQENYDEKVQSVNSLMDSVSHNLMAPSHYIPFRAPDRFVRYEMSKIIGELKGFVNAYSYVDSILLYYPDSDTVVSHSSVYWSLEDFYALSGAAYWTPDEWQGLFQEVRFIKYSSVVTPKGEELFVMLKPTASGFVVVTFHNDILTNDLYQLVNLERGLLYLADKNSNLLISRGDSSLIQAVPSPIAEGEHKTIVKLDGSHYSVHSSRSRSTGLQYVFVLPHKSFFDYPVNYVSVLLLVVFAVFGALASYVLARRNANPIVKIKEYIVRQEVLPVEGSKQGELEYISRSLEKTFGRFSDMQKELEKQLPVLRATAISNMLKGSYYFASPEESQLTAIGIEMVWENYQVAVFSLQKEPHSTIAEYNYSSLILQGLLEDRMGEMGQVYSTDINLERSAAIFNYRASGTDRTQLQKSLQAMIQFFRETHDLALTIGLSEVSASFDEIPTLYAAAEEAVAIQIFRRPGSLLSSKELPGQPVLQDISQRDRQYLEMNVRAGQKAHVEERLSELFLGKEAGNVPLEYTKYLYITLIANLQKISAELGTPLEDYTGMPPFNPAEAIFRSHNLWVIQELVLDLYLQVTDTVKERLAEASKPLEQRIMDYIQEHYSNPELGLDILAEELGLSSSYISSSFKKSTGKNFLPYLNSVRLIEAKRLLETSSLQVNDIAEQVGYRNSGILINNFKKRFGMTPGAYRESIEAQ